MENVVGGSGNDQFIFTDGGAIEGVVDGGDGTDTLDYSTRSAGVTVRLGAGSSLTNVEEIVGTAATDTLVGPAVDTSWTVTGVDEGTVVDIVFFGFENLIGAADNEDTFIIAEGGSLSGLLDGGAGGFDTLLINGNYGTMVFAPTGPSSGTVSLDGNSIAYAGLEPIANTGTATNVVFDLTSGDDHAIIEDPGTGLQIRSLNSSFETTAFTIPSGSLTINGQGGADSVEVAADLILLGASLSINAETIAVDSGVTIDTTGSSGADIILNAQAVTSGGEVPGTGLLADANSSITVTGATLTASGSIGLTAHSQVTVTSDGTAISAVTGVVITSFSSALIDIDGSQLRGTDITLLSWVEENLTADASNNSYKIVVVVGEADPEVLIRGSSILTATSGALEATAKSDVTINASAQPTSNSDSSVDAAVVSTTVGSGALLSVSESASLEATGAVTLLAISTLDDTTTADANVASTAGAAVAVSVVYGDTIASIENSTVAGSSVSLSAASDRTITTTAISSPGGSSESGSGTNASENTLSSNNASTTEGDVDGGGRSCGKHGYRNDRGFRH